MQRYDSYKPSGVKWLGEIPSHWEMISTKYIAKLYTGNSLNDASKEKYSLFSDDSYPYIASKDISLGTGTVDYDNGLYIPKDESFFEIAPKNSFLLCIEGGSAGRKKAFLDRNCCFVNKLCCFDSVLNPKYHYYFIQGDYFRTMFNCSLQGMIGGVSVSALKNFYTIVPPLEEQTAIANYLDTATAKIDAAIAQQQKMIDLLNERKQIIINRAVTKGLNPNAKMKDSGVEWIGEVPEEWGVRKLKHLGSIKSGDGIKNEELLEFGKYPVWGGNGLMGYTDKYNKDKNAIVIGRVGALCGNVRYLSTPTFVTDNALIFDITEKVNHLFLLYTMQAANLNSLNSSNAQPLITGTKVKNVVIPFPDIEEQTRITIFIKKQCENIDEAIVNCQKQISLLQERKQIIINEVVTGKIKIEKS